MPKEVIKTINLNMGEKSETELIKTFLTELYKYIIIV